MMVGARWEWEEEECSEQECSSTLEDDIGVEGVARSETGLWMDWEAGVEGVEGEAGEPTPASRIPVIVHGLRRLREDLKGVLDTGPGGAGSGLDMAEQAGDKLRARRLEAGGE